MNISSLVTMHYENLSDWTLGENKPNQTQFQTGHLLVNRMKPKFLIILVVNFVDIAHWQLPVHLLSNRLGIRLFCSGPMFA
jgi:hypothetical protein